jgi:calcium binding protein 39
LFNVQSLTPLARLVRVTRQLSSDNYVTQRQALQLLSTLLLRRSNYHMMVSVINDGDLLKLTMNLLRGRTKNIQYEAFHVFKIFVANPRKSDAVARVLKRNLIKLIAFLRKFQSDKDEQDPLFAKEKQDAIARLDKL